MIADGAMTEATQLRQVSSTPIHLSLHYQIAMPHPESHLFEVTLEIKGWRSPLLDLKMPVWTPGSYLVREYARHLQDFNVEGQQPLSWTKISKNHWQVDTQHSTTITVHYRVFANELTVRTNHLDSTHGYFNPAALCFYIPGFEKIALQITIIPPQADWRVATALPAVDGRPQTFEAVDFDTLVDSPFEVGRHQSYEFEVFGKSHQLVVWGDGNLEPPQTIADIQKIIEVEADIFGGLPYQHYLFLLHLSAQGFGGLEHKDSCTLHFSRFGFRKPEQYHRFQQLVAHEFFHLWNIKRIRPQALEVFDYDGENYTPSLWFSEGTTSYYDLVIPWRAGIYDAKTYLKNLSKEITRFLTTPGRRVQPLAESSFDAWIKLYRRDANSDNNQMSYYLKGEMVSLLLDLLIRDRHNHQRSLDNVMRQMWEQFGKAEIGFTPEQLQTVIESVAAVDLTEFFQRFLQTTEELPFDEYLQPFGLCLAAEDISDRPPHLGMTVKSEQGRDLIKFVEANSPAQAAGLDAGDELLALNGLRVTAEQMGDRLKDFHPGDAVELSFFHGDVLKTTTVYLESPRPTQYHIVSVASPSPSQQQRFSDWLGCELSSF